MKRHNFYIRRHLEVDTQEGVFIDGEHQEDQEAYICVLEEDGFIFKKIKNLKRDDWIM